MVLKDRPICTHCGVAGHTIDKCYKLHGYPLGFKFRKRPSFSSSSSVNHVTQNHEENSSETPQIPQLPITAEHCQRLLKFLQTNPHQASTNQVGSLPTIQDHIFSKMPSNIFALSVKHSIFDSNLNLPKFKPNLTDTP